MHNNARPHTANQAQQTPHHIISLDKTPLPFRESPDLALSEDHLILHLKHLAGECHNGNDDIKMPVSMWLTTQAADFYNTNIQKLVERYIVH